MMKHAPIRRSRPSEEGYILVVAIFMLALFTIALAVALPKVSKEIQRDRELETMHRGKQYVRGVKLYYKKFGAYPPSVDALVKPTNNIRFMRKKYADPTTGKEDWKPVRFGQNKAPTVMGFFGQAIGGTGGCPPNPLGGNTSQGALSSGGIGGSSSSPTVGGTPGTSTGSSSNCATTGLNPSSDTSTSASGTPPTDPNAANANATTSSTTGTTPGSTTGLSGQTVGGAGIIGFSPNSPKQSIMVYKKKNHYNEWEFVYDPIAEQMMQQGGNAANMAGFSGSSGTATGSGSGIGTTSNSGSGSSFGGSTSTSNPSGTSSTPPSTPQ
ncbi:MAG: type II secretion system protein [Terracidiphilus sp.]|jgi:type II secretory pathway pseudopilin PulG